MKKIIFLGIIALALASCGSKHVIIPQAINTINTAHLQELNLTSSDYEIFNTITAEAQVSYQEKSHGKKIIIEGEDGDFRLVFEGEGGKWECTHQGILRLGFFGRDYVDQEMDFQKPDAIVRRLAIYRAINMAKEYGADSFIEPTISTNVEQVGDKVYFKSTVVTKLLRLKPHK